jgi:hypothetical protein
MGPVVSPDHTNKYYGRLGFQKFCLDIHLSSMKLVPISLLHTGHWKETMRRFILSKNVMLLTATKLNRMYLHNELEGKL